MAPPCLMYGSESRTLRNTDERRLDATITLFLRYVAGYALWDKEGSHEIRSQLGMRKSYKQTYGSNKNWPERL
jgi:hypothetical protein